MNSKPAKCLLITFNSSCIRTEYYVEQRCSPENVMSLCRNEKPTQDIRKPKTFKFQAVGVKFYE